MSKYIDETGLNYLWGKVKSYVAGLGFYTKPSTGIPASDIASGVIPTVPTSLSSFTDDLGSSPTHTHLQYLTSHQDISGKENTSNKVTSLSSSSTDTQYPSAKCVYDFLNSVPYEAKVEYIGLTGTQYINLDYWTGTNLNIQVTLSINTLANTEQDIIGNQCGANGTQRRFILCVHNSKFCIVLRHSGGGDNLYFSSNYAANTKYNVFASMEPTNNSRAVSVDGIVARGTLSFCTDNAWAKIRVGAGYASGGSLDPNYYFSGKIYNIKIVGDGILLYDLEPVRINQTGYLYDKVSGELFGNVGTGNFTLGPDVT